MVRKIHSLLVANRGEIALRIIKTCHEAGIRAVGIYSDVDAELPYVRHADESYCIGPAPARESYLNGAGIIKVAKSAKVDAIHPGYGFLSENADFVELVQNEGFVFVGPDPSAIRLMGDKMAARRLADSLGTVEPNSDDYRTYRRFKR